LQELLAPGLVVFMSRHWQMLGHKGHSSHGRSGMSMQTGPLLEDQIAKIASVAIIPRAVLHRYDGSEQISAEEKLTWADDRATLHG
jgi:hypothetical protein